MNVAEILKLSDEVISKLPKGTSVTLHFNNGVEDEDLANYKGNDNVHHFTPSSSLPYNWISVCKGDSIVNIRGKQKEIVTIFK